VLNLLGGRRSPASSKKIVTQTLAELLLKNWEIDRELLLENEIK